MRYHGNKICPYEQATKRTDGRTQRMDERSGRIAWKHNAFAYIVRRQVAKAQDLEKPAKLEQVHLENGC